MAEDMNIRTQLKAIEYDSRRLRHGGSRPFDVSVQLVEGSADQHRIVHRSDDLDTAFGCKAARQPKHLGAVCLHRVVQREVRLGVWANSRCPSESRVEAEEGIRGGDDPIGPGPKDVINFAV